MDGQPAVLVIGAGVSGLTTALCLRERGLDVTVVAEKFAPGITSVVAGALWEWPPAVCGYHHDQISLSRSKDWCMTSYSKFIDLANDGANGVFFRPVVFYFKRPVEESPRDLSKMLELKEQVLGFAHDASLIETHGVNPELGLRDAYMHLAPMVDTDRYMEWLLAQVRAAGCRILQERLQGCLMEQVPKLQRTYRVDAIVNCAGLGARELAAEDMYPLRGALVRVLNDGSSMPRLEAAHCISHDESQDSQDIVFIVPRGNDRLVLGGLAEADEWSLDIGLDSYAPVREMYERCLEFLPILRQAPLDTAEPVRVGLRPFRRQNVRLEREPGMPILHNYGHGGAGVTLSWGCSLETAQKVEEILCLAPISAAPGLEN
ncbi:MAG TPA: FAD-dependent oxidoreductase [Thermoanaerobaculia bacterium]|nr:FAD-dependent oxidoreductase [Thermoanaerobaculia bacterium]